MKNAWRRFALACLFALVAVLAGGCVLLVRQRAEAAELARQLAEMQQEQASLEEQLADVRAQLAEAIQRAEDAGEQLAALQGQAQAQAQALREAVQVGDAIGRVWVEGTAVDCTLYWGDTAAIFKQGAGCHASDGCVLPGENGTVFVGGHTDSWFIDLKSAALDAVIHLDTPWGEYRYRITDTAVVHETDIGACRWGDTQPNCILYTCYPFGISTRTEQRYLVYAEPLPEEESGV